jgi:hypothetical protein
VITTVPFFLSGSFLLQTHLEDAWSDRPHAGSGMMIPITLSAVEAASSSSPELARHAIYHWQCAAT